MRKSRKLTALRRRVRRAVKGGPTRLAAPPQAHPEQRNGAGILCPDTGNLVLPRDLLETDENENGLWPGRVTLVIAGLAVLFIVVITWFVTQMPEK